MVVHRARIHILPLASIMILCAAPIFGAPSVISVTQDGSEPGQATLSGPIAVVIDELDCWLGTQDGQEADYSKVRIVLGKEPGAKLAIAPYKVEWAERLAGQECRRGTVYYDLARYERKGDSWQQILDERDLLSFTSKLPVSVAIDGQAQIPSEVSLEIVLASPFWFAMFLLLPGVTVALLCVLASKSDILRDAGPPPDEGRRPYSLARLQMAVWFVLVVTGFFEIWILARRVPAIPDSLLGLMGIAAGTFLGAELISSSKRQADGSQPQPFGPASKGWFWDILSNTQGVQLHRFQILIWTVVMMIIFLSQLHWQLDLYDFDASLLGLMGISNGVFLGFKFPEETKG